MYCRGVSTWREMNVNLEVTYFAALLMDSAYRGWAEVSNTVTSFADTDESGFLQSNTVNISDCH